MDNSVFRYQMETGLSRIRKQNTMMRAYCKLIDDSRNTWKKPASRSVQLKRDSDSYIDTSCFWYAYIVTCIMHRNMFQHV